MENKNISVRESFFKDKKELDTKTLSTNLQESLDKGIELLNNYITEMDTAPVDFKDVPDARRNDDFKKYWLKNLDYTYWTEICPQRNEVAVSGYTPYNVSTFKDGNTMHYIYKELDVLSAKGLSP